MQWKFLSNLAALRRGRNNSNLRNPVAHAITGSPGALSGPYGTVFDPARAGWDIEEAVKRGIERVTWVFRCVDVIAGNQAWLPLVLRDEDPLDGPVVDKSEYRTLFYMLNRRTNSYEDSFQFRYRLSGVLLLSKRGAFIEVVRNSAGDPVNLHILPPGEVEPIPHPTKFVSGYRLTNVDRSEEELPPEKVLWLRTKPHPTDPYAQMTPLMAAGLAADTDYLAKTFNRNFLNNDGRPGMLVGIRGRLGVNDAKEIKDRFRGGVDRAGTTTVVEADGIDVMDLGANPRDVQWLEGIKGSKDEIMMAFGVPESKMGNASGRTFDNADAENENFWEDTMRSHCNPLARGLDPLTGDVMDERFVSFDYDNVDVLQRRKRQRQEKAKEDYEAGLLTFDEYREAVGLKPLNVPASRIYYHTNGIPIAADEADTEYVAKMPIIGAQKEVDPAMAAQEGAAQGADEGRRILDNIIGARAFQLSRVNTDVNTQQSTRRAIEAAPKPRVRSMFKSLQTDDKHPYEGLRARIEGEFEGALEIWDTNQTEVAATRLDHSKVRMFTRHWDGDGAGTKALNPDYLVQVDRWTGTLERDMGALLKRHARNTVRDTAKEMVVGGVARAMHSQGYGSPQGRSNTAKVFGSTQDADSALKGLLEGLQDVVRRAGQAQAQRVKDRIVEMDEDGASLTQIKAEVRRMTGRNSNWRKQLATYLTTAIVEGSQLRTWQRAGELVEKTWNTQEDERVRHSHREADGQTVGVSQKFTVGGSKLMCPGDPGGNIGEIAGCRCWLGYAIADSAGRIFDEAG